MPGLMGTSYTLSATCSVGASSGRRWPFLSTKYGWTTAAAVLGTSWKGRFR